MTTGTHTRRNFLASFGALSAATLMPRYALAEENSSRLAGTAAANRGISRASDDFAFAPGLVYLQTGSLGPTPRPVMERASAAWTQLGLNPAFYAYQGLEHEMEIVRAKAATFMGCKTDELVITTSTTAGMNWTAQGLAFAPGDRILTTDQEHPGGRVCWDYVARRYGVILDVVAIPPGEHDAQAIIASMTKAFTPRTRVLSFSHILSSTGLRMPVAELSALARSRGCIAVVDGAQAVGSGPVDVKALGCHVYATSGHKWLLGPPGTGLLYLSEELGKTIDPIPLQSGRASYSASSGVPSIPSVLGLGAAIDYVSAIGLDRIEAHNLALRSRLYAALQNVPRVRVVSAPSGPLASALLSYTLPENIQSGALHERLRDKHKIEVKVVPGNWFNGSRISMHLFNSEQDVDALVAALNIELA
ncbi:MAG: aminotransferase class V-fold PLP-dependent enzyme [Gemmatimonadaceae bacterium]